MAPLPPGVYFNPLAEECIRYYLRPWIESGCDNARTPMHGAVFPVDVYKHRPDELRWRYTAGHARAFERKWYFLTPRGNYGRRVATGGNWRVEQKIKDVPEPEAEDICGGKRRTFGFYLPGDDRNKTPWLMEELTAVDGEGGKGGETETSVPVFCRIYVSPRADIDDRRAILGEDGVAVDSEGKAKPATVAVDEAYFDLLAARLPASCIRVPRGGQGHPTGDFGHQAGHVVGLVVPPPAFLGHHYIQPPPPPPPAFPALHYASPPAVHGLQHCNVQVEAPLVFLGQYPHHQNAGFDYPVAPPAYFLGPYPHDQNAGFDHPAAPPVHLAPQQYDEDIDRMEKRPRLTYALPAPQPVAAMDSTLPKCNTEASEFQAEQCCDGNANAAVFHQEPAPTVPTPQEESPAQTAPPPPPVDEALPPQPPAVEFDACQQAPYGSMDLSNLTQESFGGDFGMAFGRRHISS